LDFGLITLDQLSSRQQAAAAADSQQQPPGGAHVETKGNLPANSELVLWVIHSKVVEAFWQQGEIFPNRVIVDDVLN
jgi:hypothetical protein